MKNARSSSLVGVAGSTILSTCLIVACSGSDPGSDFGGSGGSGSGASDGGEGGAGNLGGGDNGGSLGGGNNGGGLGDAACAAESSKGQQQPLDIFIMLDQSGSMTETVAGGGDKWTAVTSALTTFVQSPLNGVSVGLQYFGLPANGNGGGGGGGTCPATCNKTSDCGPTGGKCVQHVCACNNGGGGGGGGIGSDSCTAADYAVADVEIAPLPGVGAAISASIAAHSPSTATPTSAALDGAIMHAKTWAQAHPDDVVIALLATDGDPTECDTNITNIGAIAAAGLSGTPKILTFVIGVGSSLGNLNAIAAAGGTTSAFIVDTTQNVNQQFLDALNKIRGAAVGCTYKIPMPKSGTPDYGKVNVQYTPSGGATVIVPKVADKAHCPATGDAWYYDNDAAPTQIILCDATCKSFTADTHSEVDVLTGCQSIVK